MPHVIVKMWPGKSEQQKQRLADAIAKDVVEVLGYGDQAGHRSFSSYKFVVRRN